MLLLSLLVLVVAPTTAPAVSTGMPAQQARAVPSCLAPVLTAVGAARPQRAFSATRITDIQVGVLLKPRVKGSHVLGLRFYTPRGHLYQELAVPFEVPAARDRRTARRSPVAARLSVGGTAIQTSSLYGTWKVVPHLDGEEQACGAATRFRIRQ